MALHIIRKPVVDHKKKAKKDFEKRFKQILSQTLLTKIYFNFIIKKLSW